MALPWETFRDEGNSDEEEVLSLSDLPIESPGSQEKQYCNSQEVVEEFVFRACGRSGDGFSLKELPEPDMCIADDIFFRGRLLPLCASFDSRSCYDLPSSNPSSGFGESRSNSSSNNSISSSSCSSTCISRSQSSSSHSSNSDLPPRQSTSNKFYAHPSPRPQVIRTKINPGPKSTGTTTLPGWIRVLRLGVVKVPQIEINDLRSRRMRVNDSKCNDAKVNKSMPRFRFGCKCIPDVIEPVAINPTRPLIEKKKKKKKVKLERRDSSSRRSRVFEWLEELSIGKV